ncbi:MAG: Si-specific NAD(P)(+) transhydrogenase [Planctomycetota bacterium]
MEKFDLAVIGLGPAGHFGAIQAAKEGKRVVAIEASHQVGGAAAVTGTIPSKALREATIHLAGVRQKAFYGRHYRVKGDLTMRDLTQSTDQIISQEVGVLESQLTRNGVQVVRGYGSFISPTQVVSEGPEGVRVFEAKKILIAVGSHPARAPGVDFDGHHIIDSSQILKIDRIPRRLTVVGAGVIGVEYACIFAALGARVTLVNKGESFLEFLDQEILDVLRFQMQSNRISFCCGESVEEIKVVDGEAVVRTESNKVIHGDCVLYSIGRQGSTQHLSLEAAGLEADKRGRLQVNESFQTPISNIYAAGDVIGFPALAATSREQGRRAICHAFDFPFSSQSHDLPYGIYTIPEISTFGPSERELTRDQIPYEVGRAWYGEIARGHILGDLHGLLKIVFDPNTLKLQAVHAIGDGATELIHIGQAVKALEGTIEYFIDAVFNYPTLAECYKVAAQNGYNRAAYYRPETTNKSAPTGAPQEEPDVDVVT